MRFPMKHILVACVLAVASLTVACSNSPTQPSPFNQTINGNLASFEYVAHNFTPPRTGTLTVVLTWTAAADRDLDLYLTDATCDDIYGQTPPCTFLEQSIASTGNSERITRAVQQGTPLRLWVDSFSFSGHNYTMQITIE